MTVTFRCPECDRSVRSQVVDGCITCPACTARIRPVPGSWDEGRVRRCLVCPSTDLYVRKDFPQQWGLVIIVIGFVLSSIAWAYYQSILSLAILLVSAALDATLYMIVGDVLACYRCHAEYRGVEGMSEHPRFDLTVHEKYRQQAARMAALSSEETLHHQ